MNIADNLFKVEVGSIAWNDIRTVSRHKQQSCLPDLTLISDVLSESVQAQLDLTSRIRKRRQSSSPHFQNGLLRVSRYLQYYSDLQTSTNLYARLSPRHHLSHPDKTRNQDTSLQIYPHY